MSEAATKGLYVDLPVNLLREAKADVARRGVTLRQLYTELTEEYLLRRREDDRADAE